MLTFTDAKPMSFLEDAKIVRIDSNSSYNQQVAPQQAAQLEQFRSSSKTSLQLKIKTNEGDVVTLSLDARQFLQDSKGPKGEQISSKSSYSFKASVQGDLNPTELADISKLAQSLSKSLDDIKSGNLQDAIQDIASSNSSTDSIAAFNFRFRYQQQTQYSRFTPAAPPQQQQPQLID